MTTLWAKQALLADGWAEAVQIKIGDDGRIAAIQENAQAIGDLVSILLPAPANSHSHAFQRAMAGLTEKRGETRQTVSGLGGS